MEEGAGEVQEEEEADVALVAGAQEEGVVAAVLVAEEEEGVGFRIIVAPKCVKVHAMHLSWEYC